MTREDLIEKYVAVHAECRWMDAGDLDDLLHSFVKELDLLELPGGLKEAARKYRDYREECGIKDPVMLDEIEEAHYAGAEYQRKQDQSLIELAEDHAMLAGMNKMKEEMMERAVEADVNTYKDLATGESWAEFVVKMPTKNLGDKVKVIVIPEEK